MQAVKFYNRPAIPLTVALAAGIGFGSLAPGFGIWALAMTAASGCAVAVGLVRRTPAVISPLLLFCALGYLSLQPWVCPRFPENHISRFLDTGPWHIVGVVDGRPFEFESRTRLVLRVERLEAGGETHWVSGLLRVTVAGEAIALEQGDRVGIRSRIRALRNFNNPGGFDFKRSMAYREIWGSAFAEARNLSLIEKEVGVGWIDRIDRVRRSIAELIDQAGLGPEAALLKALVIGDQSQVPPESRHVFTRTGTSHILAISGLHISLVASVAFALLRWLLSWLPPAIRHAWTRKGAAVLTLFPASLYALLAGFSPSTQRALLMVSVFLLAFLAERETDLMNTLAMAALGILMVQPAALFSISFQLSFAAVISIIYGLDRMRALRSAVTVDGDGRAAKIKRAWVVFVAVSLVATWGTLPLGMYYFNTVSFIGLPANFLAIPLMGYVVVVVGLFGTLLAPFCAAAAVVCYQASGWVLTLAIAFLEFLSALPFAATRTITPSGFELILFYLMSWLVVRRVTDRNHAMTLYSDEISASTIVDCSPVRRLSRAVARVARAVTSERRWILSLLVICSIGVCVDVSYWLFQRFGRKDLQVTLLDVGQGSAVLIEFPGGETALVDGGGFADMTAFDVGANVVAPFLWRRKIASIDTLVLTHPNSDHLNGLIFIAENFNVQRLWTNGESRPLPGYELLLRTARERGIAVPRYAEIPRSIAITDATLEVLYPPVDFLRRAGVDRWRRDENNNSLVTRVSLGAVSLLIPGDIMQPAEKELVAVFGDYLKSTVLIAPHHGSRSSSSDALLARVTPQAVFISCAGRPGSGLPHPSVIERYERHGVRVYRTDRHGAIRLATDGGRISITTWVNGD